MEEIDNKWLFHRVESTLKNGEQVKIRLVGQSMYPFLNEQTDVLTIAPISGSLQVGDIVLADIGGDYVLHRLIGIKDGWYELQGDANLKRKESVHPEKVMGILVSLDRNGTQTIHCTNTKWRLKGWLWIRLRFARKELLKVFSWRRRLKKRFSADNGK